MRFNPPDLQTSDLQTSDLQTYRLKTLRLLALAANFIWSYCYSINSFYLDVIVYNYT